MSTIGMYGPTIQNCPPNGYELMIMVDFNAIAVLEVHLYCSTCGWKGDEIWGCRFKEVKTIVSPKPKKIEPPVPMHETTSLVIHKVGYDPELNHLFIKFRSGDKVYGYKDVPANVFINFINAERTGQHYSHYIRGRYERI